MFLELLNNAYFNGISSVDLLKDVCLAALKIDRSLDPFLEPEEYDRKLCIVTFGGHIEQMILSKEYDVEFVIVFMNGFVQRVASSNPPPRRRVYLEYCGIQPGILIIT